MNPDRRKAFLETGRDALEALEAASAKLHLFQLEAQLWPGTEQLHGQIAQVHQAMAQLALHMGQVALDVAGGRS